MGDGKPKMQLRLPAAFQVQRLPLRVVIITALLSYGLQLGAIIQGMPIYVIVGLTLLPWVLVFSFEYIWKYEHYGFFAFFMAFVLLQLGHLSEHTVQISQLIATGGILAKSHGIFGQLDLETVHVVWDSAVWTGLAITLYKFSHNRWLYVAFFFASAHEVEHLYLYYIYNFDHAFYLSGGFSGVLGNGGVIGSPLLRPYLHFFYNFLVVVPMLIAFVRQTTHAYDQYLARALPHLSETELVATTNRLQRVIARPGEVIVSENEPSDRFYIVTEGEVSKGAFYVQAKPAAGSKCERCWRFTEDVGNDARYPTVCLRCADALEAINFSPYTAPASAMEPQA